MDLVIFGLQPGALTTEKFVEGELDFGLGDFWSSAGREICFHLAQEFV